MLSDSIMRRELFWLILVLSSALTIAAAFEPPAKKAKQDSASPKSESFDGKAGEAANADKPVPPRQLFRGQVVLAQAALKKRGIKVAEELKNQAVFETATGELIPIAADWRGRAFYQDERLRDRPIEVIGYRQEGIPYLQILTIYVLNKDKDGQREEMDYWCEICSIPMFEIKDCECCQGPILLRLRPAKLPDYLTTPLDASNKTNKASVVPAAAPKP